MTVGEQASLAQDSAGINFGPTAEHQEIKDRIAAFVARDVIPVERDMLANGGMQDGQVLELRALAREAGVYGPQIPVELGGLGLDWRGRALAFEEAGTSLVGPHALNCNAPDEGNMQLLEQIATPEQRERYLRPLAAGKIRSCFAMTEPAPGAGADPTLLKTTARRDGSSWVIDGHKWYISGADGAAFAIVMVRTAAKVDARHGATMFVVDTSNPGFKLVRRIGSLDQSFLGGHCEPIFESCRVGAEAVLGEIDRGFDYAQIRLAPARLTHCMRWLGIARRSLDIALDRVSHRESFGQTLGEHQQVQVMLADSAMELHAARLMIWHAAWVLDQGGPARHETSMAKVFVSETVNRVVDRAIQLCGSLGISDDLPLGHFYREVRPFRIYDGPSEVHRVAVARRLLRGRGASGKS